MNGSFILMAQDTKFFTVTYVLIRYRYWQENMYSTYRTKINHSSFSFIKKILKTIQICYRFIVLIGKTGVSILMFA